MVDVRTADSRMFLHRAINEIEEDALLRQAGVTDLSATYLAGGPGCGKTMSIRELAKKHNWGLVTMNISMETVERFGGIPEIIKVTAEKNYAKHGIEREIEYHTIWSIPEVIVDLRFMAEKFSTVICFLDDWHLASPNIQQLGFELFTDYSIRGHQIPKNVVFVLAGNDKPSAGARTHFSAVMNRVAKVLVEAQFEHWRDKFAIGHGVHPAIISFLEKRDAAAFFHGEEDTINPWPSPRSWTNYSSKLVAKEKSGRIKNLEQNEQMVLCSAYVGAAAATEFQTYYQIYSKFPIDQIYKTGQFTIPNEPVDRFAFGAASSAGFYDRYADADKKGKERLSKIFSSILSSIHSKSPEIAISSIRYIAARDTKLMAELFRNGHVDSKVIEQLKRTSSYMCGE